MKTTAPAQPPSDHSEGIPFTLFGLAAGYNLGDGFADQIGIGLGLGGAVVNVRRCTSETTRNDT